MRTKMIGAATLAVAAMLSACSDGSNVPGINGVPTAGASPVSGAGTGTTASAGTTSTPAEGGASGAPASAGAGAVVTGSAGMPIDAGGSGGTTSSGTAGSGGAPSGGGAPSSGGVGGGAASTGGAGSSETGPFKVLIISTTLQYHHASVATCQQLVSDLGKLSTNPTNQWTTTIEGDDLADFTDAGLKAYRLVFSCNPTGPVFSGNSQVKDKAGAMKAFQTFVEGGGAFAGVHSASDFENTNGFPWFTNTLMGGYFTKHDNWPTAGSVLPDALNNTQPVLKGLSTNYSTQDEWYYMNRDISAQPGFKIIQRLAKDNRPLSWVKDVGTGRMFYTARGHDPSVYSEKEFKAIVQNGILWVTKRL